MQYKASSESLVAQCKWNQKKGLSNQRRASPKKGHVVYFFAFRQENTSPLVYRWNCPSNRAWKLSKEFISIALKAETFSWNSHCSVKSAASSFVLRETKEETVSVCCVTPHRLEALMIMLFLSKGIWVSLAYPFSLVSNQSCFSSPSCFS